MGLEINRNDAAAREREAMAVGGQKSEERLYETVDGKLVREGDPRGAFLKYAPGDVIADRHLKSYKELQDSDDTGVDLDAARDQLAPPDSQHEGKGPLFMSDRQATAVADEARAIAALPDEERAKVLAENHPDDNAVVADKRVWKTEDGELVAEGDSRGVAQAYVPGDRVKAHDVDAYNKVSDTDEKSTEDSESETKAADKPANKAASVTRTK